MNRNKTLDKFERRKWRLRIRRERKVDRTYHEPKYNIKYEMFQEDEKRTRLWHQARLNILPTNHFLYKIKCTASKKCVYDDETETNHHFLLKCKGYRSIWGNYYPKRNNNRIKYIELLDQDSPPPEKRKICKAIEMSLLQRAKKIKHGNMADGKEV
jgi:hypothetical protein